MKLKIFINESPILSPPRGKLKLVTDALTHSKVNDDKASEKIEKRGRPFSAKTPSSSWISEIKYNFSTSVLTIITDKEQSYSYENVSLSTYQHFKSAESKGKFFAQHIRKLSYKKTA